MIIRGNTVGTPTAKPDWNETNPNRAGYICNKPDIPSMIAEELENNGVYTGGDLDAFDSDVLCGRLSINDGEGDVVGMRKGEFDSIELIGWESDTVRLVNVAPGVNDTDAVNKWQLSLVSNFADSLEEQMGDIEAALDAIITMQNALIGGDAV